MSCFVAATTMFNPFFGLEQGIQIKGSKFFGLSKQNNRDILWPG